MAVLVGDRARTHPLHRPRPLHVEGVVVQVLADRVAAAPRPAPKGGARVLVLGPTRELVSQIADGFERFGRHLQLSVTTIFGGVSQFHQVNALKAGVDIVVAAPGRLLDLIVRRGECVGARASVSGRATEIIADGKHLQRELLLLAYKIKGPERLALVSDSESTAEALHRLVETLA